MDLNNVWHNDRTLSKNFTHHHHRPSTQTLRSRSKILNFYDKFLQYPLMDLIDVWHEWTYDSKMLQEVKSMVSGELSCPVTGLKFVTPSLALRTVKTIMALI